MRIDNEHTRYLERYSADQAAGATRMVCRCGNRKHAVQYTACCFERVGATITEYHKPRVCLVCPRCDSPGAAGIAGL